MNISAAEILENKDKVANYKEFNKTTVEKTQYYNPKAKIWYFKKTEVDPNAKKFGEKYYKNKRNNNNNSVENSKKRPTNNTREKIRLNHKSTRGKVYNLYKSGIDIGTIAENLGIPKRTAQSILKKRLYLLENVKKNERKSYNKVISLVNEGYSITEISEKLKLKKHSVCFHVTNFNNNKSKSVIDSENDEILKNIKNLLNKTDKDFIKLSDIFPAKLKLKCNLSAIRIRLRCEDLVEEGKLIMHKHIAGSKGRLILKLPNRE